MQKLRIGEAAKAVGLSTKTIRYYHEIGLLPEPMRSEGDYRLYDADDLLRLWRIRRLRTLGLSLEQIRDLLAAPVSSHAATLRTVLHTLETSLTKEIEALQQQRQSVRAFLDRESLEQILNEPAQADGEAFMALVEENLGNLLQEMSPEVLAYEKRLWSVIGSFNLPEAEQRRIEQLIAQMAIHADRLQDLLPLSERFLALADLPEDAPEVTQLVQEYQHLNLAAILNTAGANETETSIVHHTMNKLAMALLSPAQQRVMQQLIERPLLPSPAHEGGTTYEPK
jgi:DNA-binding transcriptional MerR regulator